MDHKKSILYGIGIWAFVFVVAILAFPLRTNERPLFESIMPVTLTLATSAATFLYFKNVKNRYFVQGYCLGLIWLGVNLFMDLLAFSWGPMKMTLTDYLKDIGVTYLIILIIPASVGYLLEKRKA